jgi:hypothetical protein
MDGARIFAGLPALDSFELQLPAASWVLPEQGERKWSPLWLIQW